MIKKFKNNFYMNTIKILIIVLLIISNLSITKRNVAFADMPMPRSISNLDFFKGIDEIIVWPTRVSPIRGSDDLYEQLSNLELSSNCKKFFLRSLSKKIKSNIIITELVNTNIRPYQLEDDTKLLLRCSLVDQKQIIGDKEYILSSFNIEFLKPFMSENNQNYHEKSLNYYPVFSSSPSLFLVSDIRNYKGKVILTIKEDIKKFLQRINKMIVEKE